MQAYKKNSKFFSTILFSCFIALSFFLHGLAHAQDTEYFVNVKDFGAKGDGINNDTQEIQAAINSLYVDGKGGTVYLPPGKYRIVGTVGSGDTYQGSTIRNGLYLREKTGTLNRPTNIISGLNNRITIRGAGKSTVLVGDSDNLFIIRVSTGYATIKDLTIDGGVSVGDFTSKVVGIAMVPENMQSSSTLTDISYNVVDNVHIGNTQEGILMSCGPTRGESFCYWNSFSNVSLRDMVRGIYMKSGVNGSPSINRNMFSNINMNTMNVGFHIESGDTNTCMHCTFTDITVEGSGAPKSTASAIVIDFMDQWNRWGNSSNRFYNAVFEGNERDIENAADRTEFYGIETDLDGGKNLWSRSPMAMIGTNGFFSKWPGLFVGYKTMDPSSKVALGVRSGSQGFLPPVMSTTQRNNMGSVPEGLIIYNSSTKKLNIFSNGAWRAFVNQ